MSEALKPMAKLLDVAVAMAPRVALVIGVLLLGIVLSTLAGRLVRWGLRRSGLEASAEKAGIAKVLYAIGARRGLAHLVGKIVWICGLLFTLSAVSELIGLAGIANGISALIAFVPRLFAGAAVVIAGLLVAEFLRSLVNKVTARRDDIDSPQLVGNIIYYAVLTLAVVMAIDQVGFKTDLIDALLRIGVGVVLFSVGLAFALGGRTIFRNFLARQYYQPLVRPGDHIRVGDHAGTVVRYSRVAVVIKTDTGECVIPCSLLIEQAVPLRRAGS